MSWCKKKAHGAGCLPLHSFHFLRASRFLFPLSAALLPSGCFFLSIHLALLSFGPRFKSSRSFSSVALSCQPHRMAVTAERASAARLPSCGARVCQLSFFSQKRAFHKKPCTCPAQTHLLLRASLMLTMVLSFKRNSAFWRKIGNE